MLTARPPWQMAAGLFVLCAIAIVSAWAWLGAPVVMPPSPMAAGTKLDCVSYTPYQADSSPFFEGAPPVAPSLIAADVARLAPLTKCLRTYSASGHGIGEVVPQAARQGLTVMQGIWISRDPVANAKEISAAVALAKANPNTVTALIAGNEVLLRQEQTAEALVSIIKDVKAQSNLPVTYADVWEFWIKNPSVTDAVDFITIHILPFWEDDPVSAAEAGRHVVLIYDHMAAAFPGKRIIIGEVGWPSTGRMREAALPSPANQARVLHDVVAITRAKGITANIIEAFDQPWKRQLEGTVGGHWGLFDANDRTQKFAWGEPISNHPLWRTQAAGGVALSGLVLGLCAIVAQRRRTAAVPMTAADWARIGVVTSVCCFLAGDALETLAAGAFGTSGMARTLMLGLVAVLAPFVSLAIASGASLPSFVQTIGPPGMRARCPLTRTAGFLLIATFLAATQVALSLTFNPRYWEFPFASLTGVVIALAMLRSATPSSTALTEPRFFSAEKLGSLVLAAAAVFIACNEGPHNWQALWLSAVVSLLAATLWRLKGAPGPGVQAPAQ